MNSSFGHKIKTVFANTKILALASIGVLICTSIGIYYRFTPIRSNIVGIPLVDSPKSISVVTKLVVGACLVLLPLIGVLCLKGKKFHFKSSHYFEKIESSIVTVFLAEFIFQAKFRSNYSRALLFVFLSVVSILILTLIYKKTMTSGKASRNFKYYSALYSSLVLSAIFYINFHAYNIYLFKSFMLLSCLWVLIVLLLLLRARNSQISSSNFDLIFRIPFWIFLLVPTRIGLLGLHSFESYAYSNHKLFLKGFFPWRDFSVEHGFWEDLGRNLLGSFFGGPTDWGQASGINALVIPLEALAFTYLLYALSRNALISLEISFAIQYFSGHIIQISLPRMIPILFLTVAIRKYLIQRNLRNITVVSFLAGLSLLWSFESVVGVLTITLLIALDFYRNRSDVKKYLLVSLSAFFVTILFPLILFRSVGSWVHSFLSNTSGYLLAWAAGFNLNIGPLFDLFLVLVPLFCTILAYIVYSELLGLQKYSKSTLWLSPLLFTVIIYYVKFLAWPDWHLAQSASLMISTLALIVAASKWAEFQNAKRSISIFLVAIALSQFVGITSGNTSVVRYGSQNYDSSTTDYAKRVNAVKQSFLPFLPKGENSRIFDYGNEPVTWYDILGFEPAGGDVKVLDLLSPGAQSSIINSFIVDPPDAIVWGGEYGYFNWPIPGNSLRSYLISAYILHNFHPVSTNGGYVLMLPGSDHGDLSSAQALASKTTCDWGGGNSHFIQPSGAETRLGTTRLLNAGEKFSVPPNVTNLKITSSVSGKFSLNSTSGFGQIDFALVPGENTLWVDSCPAWIFGSSNEWRLDGIEGNYKIDFLRKDYAHN